MPHGISPRLGMFVLCLTTLCRETGAATAPRASASDYPVQCKTSGLTLAAEYFGRSAPTGATTGEATIFTGYYLVVEVAVYPDRGQTVAVKPFELRLFINGAKAGLLPQSSSLVAGTLKYHGYEQGLGVDTGVGPIFIPGRSRQGPSFPGDPTDRQTPRPTAPSPDDDPNGKTQTGLSRHPDPADVLPALDLESGEASRPVSGYLYFFWRAHTKKIRDMELRWEPSFGEAPNAVLKLVSRPR